MPPSHLNQAAAKIRWSFVGLSEIPRIQSWEVPSFRWEPANAADSSDGLVVARQTISTAGKTRMNDYFLGSRGAIEELNKKENHKILTGKMMGTPYQVQL